MVMGGDDYGNKNIILKLRTERGMSQDELADKSWLQGRQYHAGKW